MRSRVLTCLFVVILFGMARPGRGPSLTANGEFDDSTTGWEKIGTVFDTEESAVLSDAESLRSVIFTISLTTCERNFSSLGRR